MECVFWGFMLSASKYRKLYVQKFLGSRTGEMKSDFGNLGTLEVTIKSRAKQEHNEVSLSGFKAPRLYEL